MDVLGGLLEGPRARGAFLIRACFDAPWSVRVEDRAPLTVMLMTRGTAWIQPAEGPPRRLVPGELAVARGPDPYTCSDSPDTPPRAVIGPGGACRTPDGSPLHDTMALGVRTWGDHPDAAYTMLIGTYRMPGDLTGRLLDALPPLAVLTKNVWDCPFTGLLEAEIGRADPGQEVVLDRLLDLLLIAALRAWFSRPEADAPAWYRALGDPVVGPELRLLHAEPARPWTVSLLAEEAGVSRAALARRFRELVGEPPISYLTARRLALAAEQLRGTDRTLSAVARHVGYATPFALSTAFKRAHGLSPQEFRAAGRTGAEK